MTAFRMRITHAAMALLLMVGILFPATCIPAKAEGTAGQRLLSFLPYTGDVNACKLTAAQAEAFAAVLDRKVQEQPKYEYSYQNEDPVPFCSAALFDAGGGIPALWVSSCSIEPYGNYDMIPLLDAEDEIWEWDGSQAVASSFRETNNCYLTSEGMVFDGTYFGTRVADPNRAQNQTDFDQDSSWNSALYRMENGRIAADPDRVYAHLTYNARRNPAADAAQVLVRTLDQSAGSPASEAGDTETVRCWGRGLVSDADCANVSWTGTTDPYGDTLYTADVAPGGAPDTWGTRLLEHWELGRGWGQADLVSRLLHTYASLKNGTLNSDPAAALTQIPYFGDRSACTLTPEAAEAMARQILQLTGEPVDPTDPPLDLNVSLCDVQGNGTPLLVLHSVTAFPALEDTVYDWDGTALTPLFTVQEANRLMVSFGPNLSGGYSWMNWYTTLMNKKEYIIETWVNGQHQTIYGSADPYDNSISDFLPEGQVIVEFDGTTQKAAEADLPGILAQHGAPTENIWDGGTKGGPAAEAAMNLILYSLGTVDAAAEKETAADRPVYSFPALEEDDADYSEIAAAVEGQGTVESVTVLRKDLCYVLLRNPEGLRGAIVAGKQEGNRILWSVTERHDSPASQEELNALAATELPETPQSGTGTESEVPVIPIAVGCVAFVILMAALLLYQRKSNAPAEAQNDDSVREDR